MIFPQLQGKGIPGGDQAVQDVDMSRLLTFAAGLVAAVLFALVMTGMRDYALLRLAFMPVIVFLV
ncbi:MAG: hypothetical protein M3422_03520, partial [Actinomycetota bacterium]|nr:hypothetical protein [Actinomycetota bacterium]